MAVELKTFLSIPHNGKGVSYTCAAIAKAAVSNDFSVEIFTPRLSKSVLARSVRVHEALPMVTRVLPYKTLRSRGTRLNEKFFIDSCLQAGKSDIAAHLWAEPTVDLCHRIRDLGIMSFREMTNCHRGSAKQLLDDEYAKFGWAPEHGITDERIEEEIECLRVADYAFCPSPMVEETLQQYGTAPERLISTSYGWDPQRLGGKHTLLKPVEGITFVFVGRKEVPKGLHILLDAWDHSNIKGRLVLAGPVADEPMRAKLAEYRSRHDVVLLDYVTDVGALYRSADVFIFPSLVEGGPQVTYEACGCGLPAIVSPMGAGRIVRHGKEGLIVNTADIDGWVAAIRMVASQEGLRRQLGAAAYERAKDFTWVEVGKRRRADIIARMLTSATPTTQGFVA